MFIMNHFETMEAPKLIIVKFFKKTKTTNTVPNVIIIQMSKTPIS